MNDLLAVTYSNRKPVHITRDYEQTLCGVPHNIEWLKNRGETDFGLRDSDDDPSCRRCIRHYCREIGQMVEHELRDMWDVSIGRGSW